MARLSGTRIEPTVEALAVVKSDPQLRTVIQFVKVGLLVIIFGINDIYNVD
jgi:hypothetical protein